MVTGDRKRNARCRNKICACTGDCFVDDGTGDFARKSTLESLADFLVEDILETSDEEIIQEAVEEFGSIEAAHSEADRIRAIVQKAILKARNTPPTQEK